MFELWRSGSYRQTLEPLPGGGHGPGAISQADRTNTLEESQNKLREKELPLLCK